MHRYTDYSWLRGFNVIPSWGARIEQAWWEYDASKFRKEIALAREVHANAIRLWIEFAPWMAKPEKTTHDFLDAVAAIDEQGMKTIPCLFNRWHDKRWDYGGTYNEDLFRDWEPKMDYVRSLVTPLRSDARILMWDLCNEPSTCNLDDPTASREIVWLARVAETVRNCGAEQPITIGTHQGGKNGQNMDIFAPLCDVLCCHPYGGDPTALQKMIVECKAVQALHGKPMQCNEAVPGCLDDLRRAECAKFTIEAFEAAGWGWMGWGLREGMAVAVRRDRIDPNGLDGQGFHAWFTAEGRLRKGLEFLRSAPKHLPPWQSI